MDRCPLENYNNCAGAVVDCYRCAAAVPDPKKRILRYDPIDPSILHPYTPPIKPRKIINQAKSTQVKRALKSEKAATLAIARTTLASGRLRHDGDALHLDSLRVERKTRFKCRAVSVTSAELVKGKQQRINVFEIDLPLCQETYYVLTQQTYQDLLSYVYHQQQLDNSNNSNSARDSSTAGQEVS